MTGRQPYDVHARLEDPMGVLAIALGQWEDRDDSKPQPEVRRAANTAMDAIDGMLRDLHAMHARLTDEIRGSDDASAAGRRAAVQPRGRLHPVRRSAHPPGPVIGGMKRPAGLPTGGALCSLAA